MEQIYTIPVNEAFDLSGADKSCGCPFCTLYNKLENDELDLILGASMMEPDVRIKTNKEGFCKTHYDMMFTRKNRLGMALTLESHLNELAEDIKPPKLFAPKIPKAVTRIAELEENCYVCKRIEVNFEGFDLALDKNIYSNIVDYELEVESSSIERAQEEIEKILTSCGIKSFVFNKVSKQARALNSLEK